MNEWIQAKRNEKKERNEKMIYNLIFLSSTTDQLNNLQINTWVLLVTGTKWSHSVVPDDDETLDIRFWYHDTHNVD